MAIVWAIGLDTKVNVMGATPSFRNECLFLRKLVLVQLPFAYLGYQRRPFRSRKLLGAAQPRCRECGTVEKVSFFSLNSVSFDFTFPTPAARVRYGLTVPYTAKQKLCLTGLCPGEPLYICK